MRIAVLCGPSSQRFLPPVEKLLMSGGHEVGRFTVTSPNRTIEEIGVWGAEAAWIEWCDSNAVHFSRALKIPMVCRLHRYEADTEWPSKMDWFHTRLVVTSKHVLKRAERRCPRWLATGARPIVIPSFVDERAFQFVARDGAECSIGTACYIIARKQPALWLELLARLPRIVQLHHAGSAQDDVLAAYLRQRATDEPILRGRVTWHGWQEDMAAWWAQRRYCLAASYDEGLSYSVIEAALTGCSPLIHWYPGAENQFPAEMLWRTTEELADRILCRVGTPASAEESRAWAEQYTVTAQKDAVLALFDGGASSR